MIKPLVRRLFSLCLVLLTIFVASRTLIRALPGDPLNTMLAETGTTIPAEELRAEMGLDRPFIPSIVADLARAFHGDFGISLLSHDPVAPLVAARFVNTLRLTLLGLGVGLALSLLLGLAAASDQRTRLTRLADHWCTVHGALAAALPMPWIGPVLIYFLAVKIPIFPLGGNILLPALCQSLVFSGLWARLIRVRVRETLAFGSARGARARGLPEWKVVFKYGLVPCSGSLLSYLGTQVGYLLGGTLVTEVVFDYPGLGSLLLDAVLSRDYPVVEAAVFAAAAVALLGTALGDWAQVSVDPRQSGASS